MLLLVQFSLEGTSHPGTGEGDQHHDGGAAEKAWGRALLEGSAQGPAV